jgi:hypothetical protein
MLSWHDDKAVLLVDQLACYVSTSQEKLTGSTHLGDLLYAHGESMHVRIIMH